MNVIKIEKQDWADGLQRLKTAFRLIGPVKDDLFYQFKELDENELPDLNFLNTRLSPKSIVYPQSEVMLEYTLDEREQDHHILKEVEKDYSPRAVIGIRPCDAFAFVLVQKNFDTPEHKDPYWIRSYEATTFVGLACSQPCSTCFCTTTGSGPFHEAGLDVLLVDAGDYFLAKAVTGKGKDFLKAAGWNSETGGQVIDSLQAAAESKIRTEIHTGKVKDKLATDLYEAPFWDDVAFSCINCGTCTYVCPTCWCFDIQDENYKNTGVRIRNWDSCMYPLFTLHASGHNPRGPKTHRVRQRFMHKLKYYVDKYDSGIQCVGCGRCIRLCPVNIDIRRVCELMNRYDPAAGTAD
jgi:sulfhydrogenase subunit beta (sulfur reductase)